jgi:RND family efflux transporter MFP subunit
MQSYSYGFVRKFVFGGCATWCSWPGALILLLASASCGTRAQSVEPAPAPEVVTRVFEPSAAGALVLRGTVVSATRLALAFKTSGVVASVSAKSGERVQKGQILATLAEGGASASLLAAQQRRDKARGELEVSTDLVASGALAKRQLELARVELRAAEAEYALASEVASGARLTSPVAGTVWRRAVEPGQFVLGGSPAVVIDETSRLVVRASARQADLARVRASGAIVVSAAEGGEALAADLVSVASAPGGDGLYEVEAAPREAGSLVPGALATLRFEVGGSPGELRVPSDAIVYRNERPLVWVVEGEGAGARVVGREVAVERHEGRDVILRSGLQKGERFVVEGGYFFRDGQPVRPAP